MAAKYFDLQVPSGGATCKSFLVEWEDVDCINQVCEVGSDGILHIQIPEDCFNECIGYVVTCLDDCTTCEPIRGTVCPCTVPMKQIFRNSTHKSGKSHDCLIAEIKGKKIKITYEAYNAVERCNVEFFDGDKTKPVCVFCVNNLNPNVVIEIK